MLVAHVTVMYEFHSMYYTHSYNIEHSWFKQY